MMRFCFLLTPVFILFADAGNNKFSSQHPDRVPREQAVPCKDENIPRYKAHRITSAPDIDGKLDEHIWKNAPQSSRFVDLVHGTTTHLDTRAAVLWDDDYLYVAYWIEEPSCNCHPDQARCAHLPG